MANEKTKGVNVTPDQSQNNSGEQNTPPIQDSASNETVTTPTAGLSAEQIQAMIAAAVGQAKAEAKEEAKAELRAEIATEMASEIKKQSGKSAAPVLSDEVVVKAVEEKMVTFLPTVDHKCHIGHNDYVFKAEKEQKVPLSVATILSKAKIGYMVKGV
jgi:hypothetical protein